MTPVELVTSIAERCGGKVTLDGLTMEITWSAEGWFLACAHLGHFVDMPVTVLIDKVEVDEGASQLLVGNQSGFKTRKDRSRARRAYDALKGKL